jgi:hypothetical protein
VKFKIHENLPSEAAETLRQSGFAADTVADEDLSGSNDETVAGRDRSEDRILLTLDLDFANIRSYPPASTPGSSFCGSSGKTNRQCSAISGGWRQRWRNGARMASCGSSMVIEYAFAKAIDSHRDVILY